MNVGAIKWFVGRKEAVRENPLKGRLNDQGRKLFIFLATSVVPLEA